MPDPLDQRMAALCRCIDDLLVASHGTLSDLAADHPPFWTPPDTGVGREQRFKTAAAAALDRYGPGPLFNLWLTCRALTELRRVWTGTDGQSLPNSPTPPAGA